MEQKIIYILTPGTRFAGFFSYFNQVLSNLHLLTNDDKMYVKFDHNTPYVDPSKNINMWENYFYQPTKIVKSDFNTHKVLTDTWFQNRYEIPFSPNPVTHKDIETCNKIIKKYIKLKPHILDKVDNFYNTHFNNKKILSVHKRGTDHYKEVKPIELNEYFIAIDKIENKFDYIFLCTDELETLEKFKQKYNSKLIVYNSLRTEPNNKNGVHYTIGLSNPYLMGEQVLVEVILMSKTDYLIKTVSNVSNAVLFFNKDLKYSELIKD